MTTYEGPQGRIVVTPPAGVRSFKDEVLDWASTRPALSLGIALGLGLVAAWLVADRRGAGRRGGLSKAGRFAAAGLVGQASSFLLRFVRELVLG
jgi:hypothetical protein